MAVFVCVCVCVLTLGKVWKMYASISSTDSLPVSCS